MLSLLKINHQLDESSSSGKCISCFQIVGYGLYQEWLRPAIFQCPCWPRAKVLSPLCSPKEEGRRGAVHICWGNTSTGSWRTSAFCASPRRAYVRRRAKRSQTRWATAMIAVSLTRLCSYLDNNFLCWQFLSFGLLLIVAGECGEGSKAKLEGKHHLRIKSLWGWYFCF